MTTPTPATAHPQSSRTIHPPFPSAAARPPGTPLPPGLPDGIPPTLELDILIEDLTFPRISFRDLAINHKISFDLMADLLECDYVVKRVERLKALALWRARFVAAAAAPAAAEQLSLIVYDDDARFETRRRAASHILRLAVERAVPPSQTPGAMAAAPGGHAEPTAIPTSAPSAAPAAIVAIPDSKAEPATLSAFPTPAPGRRARAENPSDRRTEIANPRPESSKFTRTKASPRGGGNRIDRKIPPPDRARSKLRSDSRRTRSPSPTPSATGAGYRSNRANFSP